MSFNGSGTFVINSAGQPVVSGTVISSTAFNALTADLANGLSTCITKDGQTTPTADIPMGSNKITGLANGTAAGDAANLGQVQSTVAKLLGSVSGADTITAVGSPTVAAYAAGQMFYFVAAGANTGAVTINIDSLGAKNITRDGTTALAAGDIQSGEVCVIVYDGTQFQLVNGASQSASIVTENLTVNKATVLNESGGDNDTRIEGDTDANLFFVDASTDRIGVGTNAPGAKAEIYVNRTSSTNAVSLILNDNVTGAQTNGVYKAIRSLSNNGASVSEIRFMETDGTNNNTSISFATQSTASALTERLRIDQNGNLGLGVTPSAWYSGYTAQQLGASASIFGNKTTADTNITSLANNAFLNSSTNWIYINTDEATRYSQVNGQHQFFTAASGTAGNTITFTQALTLDASGRLALGRTSATDYGAGAVTLSTDGSAGSFHDFYYNGTRTGIVAGVSGEFVLDTTTGVPLVFKTVAVERARITAGGVLCVGTTAENSAQCVSVGSSTIGNGNRGLFTVTSGKSGDTSDCVASFVKFSNDSTTSQIFIKFGIDSYNSGCGQINANGASQAAFGSFSDRRLKENIVDLGSQWESVKSLRPVEFDYIANEGGGHQLGFIAQEVQQVYPDIVGERADGMLTLSGMGKGEARLIKALQEAMTRIEELEAKVAALEAK